MNLTKIVSFSAAFMLAFVLFAGTASAAANLTFLTANGATNATVQEGSDVEAKVTFDITTSTDVESMSWELVGSGLPQTCVNTTDRIADGTFTSSFDIDTEGASEGTWDVRIRAYGDDGADVSNLCEVSDQVDSQSFTDRITVTDDVDDNQGNGGNSGNTGGTGNASSTTPAWFTAWFNGPFAAILAALKPTTQAPTALCAQLPPGTNVTSLQQFLMANGQSIPALTQGAAYGYLGPQTLAALSNFKAVNHCVN